MRIILISTNLLCYFSFYEVDFECAKQLYRISILKNQILLVQVCLVGKTIDGINFLFHSNFPVCSIKALYVTLLRL